MDFQGFMYNEGMKSQYERTLDLKSLLEKKSHFLFGPRATGKSSLIRNQLINQAVVIDLLRSEMYLRLSSRPWELESIIEAANPKTNWVVIDEVQKTTNLLDEVHRLIEEKGYYFLLTGSSARKLKKGQANLLAGRAWQAELYPLTYNEITDFDLHRILRYGGLPGVYKSTMPDEELDAYVHTYLYEEIQAEGLVRKLPQFARFLQVAALSTGDILNFTKIGNDAQLSPSTVRDYYQILTDTFLGYEVPSWDYSKKRKAVTTSKFYLFDTGVTHTIMGTKVLEPHTELYGKSFEQWVAMELRAALSYFKKKKNLYFWRTTTHIEVDFVVPDNLAIEVKSAKTVGNRDAKGLRAFKEESAVKRYIVVSHDLVERKDDDGIEYTHWKTFMQRLWSCEYFSD